MSDENFEVEDIQEELEHSILSPSKAPMYCRCVASIAAGKNIKPVQSEFADEGTLAHALAARILGGELNVEVSEDMLYPLKQYIDKVDTLTADCDFAQYEMKLDLSEVLKIPGEKGTADVFAINSDRKQLIIADLKYGKGVRVVAFENEQIMTYALGGLLLADDLGFEIDKVKMVIHMPRKDDGYTEYDATVEELLKWGTDVLRPKAARALELYNDPSKVTPEDYCPGEKQCRFCLARGTCIARMAAETANMAEDFTACGHDAADLPSIPVTMPLAEAYAILLPKIDRIQRLCKAVQEGAHAFMLNGNKVEGQKLIIGRAGNRKWSDAKKAEELLKSMRLKVGQMYEMKVISPSTAEKLLKGSSKRWKRVVELIEQAPGKPSIVSADDPRLEYIPAIEAFEAVTEVVDAEVIG